MGSLTKKKWKPGERARNEGIGGTSRLYPSATSNFLPLRALEKKTPGESGGFEGGSSV